MVYGDNVVLDGLDLEIPRGQVVAETGREALLPSGVTHAASPILFVVPLSSELHSR